MTLRKIKLTNDEVFVVYDQVPTGWEFQWTTYSGSAPSGDHNIPRNIRAVLLARSRLGEVCPELVYSTQTGEILMEKV